MDAEYALAHIYVIVRWADGEEPLLLDHLLEYTGSRLTLGVYSLDMTLTDLAGVVRRCPDSTIPLPPELSRRIWLLGVGDPNATAIRIERLVCRGILDPRASVLDIRLGVDEVEPISFRNFEPQERLRWAAPLTAHGVKGRSKHIGGRRWILFEIDEP